MDLIKRLSSLGISLPTMSGPFGAYIPAKQIGNLLYIAGQLPMKEGKLLATGQVSSHCTVDQARLGARQCVINALTAANSLLGSLDKLKGVVRIAAFVNSEPGFTEQPKIANGASELLIEIFGDTGKHVRAAVGVSALPLDAAVEIEFIFEIE